MSVESIFRMNDPSFLIHTLKLKLHQHNNWFIVLAVVEWKRSYVYTVSSGFMNDQVKNSHIIEENRVKRKAVFHHYCGFPISINYQLQIAGGLFNFFNFPWFVNCEKTSNMSKENVAKHEYLFTITLWGNPCTVYFISIK